MVSVFFSNGVNNIEYQMFRIQKVFEISNFGRWDLEIRIFV